MVSCPRRSRSRSRRGIGEDKRKDRQRPKARDCRSWASPFRTDGRRRTGGPSGDSGRRVGSGPTRETDGTNEFERAKEPSLGKQMWGSQPTRRSSGTKWEKEGRGESNVEAYASVARVLDYSGRESSTCFSPRRYTCGGITRKAERGAGAFGAKAPRPEMVARSVGREGTRIDCRRIGNGGTGQSAQERPGREFRRHGEEEPTRARTRGQEKTELVLKRRNGGVQQHRRGPGEREDDSKVRRTAASKPGALLHSGLVVMHRHLGRQVEDCETVDAVQAKGVAAAAECQEQARVQEHSRIAVFSRSRRSADAWTSGECRRRPDPEVPRSGSGGTGGREMVTRTSSRTAARSSSVDSVIWSSGSDDQSRAGFPPIAPEPEDTSLRRRPEEEERPLARHHRWRSAVEEEQPRADRQRIREERRSRRNDPPRDQQRRNQARGGKGQSKGKRSKQLSQQNKVD